MSCGHAAEQARQLELEGRARPDAALRQRAREVQRHVLAANRDLDHLVAREGLLSDPGAGPAACRGPGDQFATRQNAEGIGPDRARSLAWIHSDVDARPIFEITIRQPTSRSQRYVDATYTVQAEAIDTA